MSTQNYIYITFLSALICLALTSCNKPKGYDRNPGGMYSHFYIVNPDQPKPETGDFVEVNIGLRTDNEIISPMNRNSMTIDEKLYKGDLYCALQKMHVGDSATFILKGKKFYEEFLNLGDYPYGKDPIYADVKLLKIMSKKKIELAEENFKENKKRLRHVEDSLIADYVVEHHIDVKKNGIYRYVNTKTDGQMPKKGQSVQVLYKAYFLDGTQFYSCSDRDNPQTFEIGKNQIAAGIEAMVQQMHVGEDVTIVVPSRMAFSEAGNTELKVPPYTPVVFRLELVRIVK